MCDFGLKILEIWEYILNEYSDFTWSETLRSKWASARRGTSWNFFLNNFWMDWMLMSLQVLFLQEISFLDQLGMNKRGLIMYF